MLQRDSSLQSLITDSTRQSSEISTLKSQLEDLSNKLTTESSLHKSVKQTIIATEARLQTVSDELHSVHSQYEELQQENKAVLLQLTDTEAKVTEEKRKVTAAYQTLAITKRELEGEKQKLTGEKAAIEKAKSDLEQKLTVIRSTVISLEGQVKSLEATRDSLTGQVAEIREGKRQEKEAMTLVIDNLKSEVDKKNKDIDRVRSDLNSAQSALKSMQNSFDEQTVKLTELLRVKENLEKEVQHLTSTVTETNTRLGEEAKKRASQGDQSAKLREDLRITEQHFGDLRVTHEATLREIEQVRAVGAGKEKELTLALEQSRKENFQLSSALSDLEAEVETLTATLQQKDSELLHRDSSLQTSKRQIESLLTDSTHQSSEISTLKSQLSDISTKLKNETRLTEATQSRLETIIKQTELSAKQTEEDSEVIHKLQSAKFALEQEKEEQIRTVDRLETQLNEELHRNSVLQSDISSLKNEQESLISQILELRDSKKSLEKLQTALETQLSELKAKHDVGQSCIDALNKAIFQHESNVKSANSEKNNLAAKIAQFEGKIAELEGEKTNLTVAKTQLATEISSLRLNLTQETEKVSNLTAKLTAKLVEFDEERKKRINAEQQISLLEKRELDILIEKDTKQSALNNEIVALRGEIGSLKAEIDSFSPLNAIVQQSKKPNENLPTALARLITDLQTQISTFESRITSAEKRAFELTDVNAFLVQENESFEKEKTDLADEVETLKRENADLTEENERLVAQLLDNEKSATSRSLNLEIGEEIGGTLSQVDRDDGEAASSQSLELGDVREEDKLASEFINSSRIIVDTEDASEPIETDPPLLPEDGEQTTVQMKLLADLLSTLSRYRNPNEDPLTTLKKLGEEFELLKKNPSRFMVPRLTIPSQRDSKESQTSQRESPTPSQTDEVKSQLDSSSVNGDALDKSFIASSDAADQDTPRQKILPELWKKKVSHEIRQVKSSEIITLRNQISSLEKDLSEERTIHEHLEMQNRLLKEEVAEKTRHIKRLEVAETGGEKSPVNIEHLKDVLVKLIMQLPNQ